MRNFDEYYEYRKNKDQIEEQVDPNEPIYGKQGEWTLYKQHPINEMCCGSIADNSPLELKMDVYKAVTKLKNSRAFGDVEKALAKISKDSYDGRWRVENILGEISLKQLCDLRAYEDDVYGHPMKMIGYNGDKKYTPGKKKKK